VVQGGTTLQVGTLGGEIYDNVYYVTSDPRRDLAIIRIPIDRPTPLQMGEDVEAEVGARVYVMGNPMGQTGTFSDGLVSARRMMEGVSMLQITAPISPGSSGGPVMNEQGQVIGVATMMIVGGQNLNYAVPVRYVRPLVALGEQPRRFDPTLLPVVAGGLASTYGPDDPVTPAPPPLDPDPLDPPAVDSYEQYVMDRLDELWQAQIDAGYTLDGEYTIGRLLDDESEDIYFTLYAGYTYRILGACDSDCTDMDLIFYGQDGTVIVEDRGISAAPAIDVEITGSGDFRTEVRMYACGAGACRYGLAVYARPTGP
jgi:hypothetical protein